MFSLLCYYWLLVNFDILYFSTDGCINKSLTYLLYLLTYTIICLSICDDLYHGTQVGVGVDSFTVVFLRQDFLFTSSDTFAVKCIAWAQIRKSRWAPKPDSISKL